MEDSDRENKTRVYGLDVLRASAILFVVYTHLIYEFVSEFVQSDTLHILRIPIIDGVTLFFVLSGFLIGGILIRQYESENSIGVGFLLTFWRRRWMRTLPNYYLVMGITYVALSTQTDAISIVEYVFFIQNFNKPHPPFYPEAWSLSVEEWFYLLLPLTIAVLHYSGLKKQYVVLSTVIAFILACTLFRLYRYLSYPDLISISEWTGEFRKQVLMRLDAIAYGVLGVYVKIYLPRLWSRSSGYLFLAGLLLIASSKFYTDYVAYNIVDSGNTFQFGFFENVVFFAVMPIGTLLLLPKLEALKPKYRAISRVITWISLISYSMYLLHLTPIITLLKKNIPSSTLVDSMIVIPVYLFLVFGVSSLLYKYYEKPILLLRNRRTRHESASCD
jgi:peptidoglycan/LPS O-acetylase OafA/YrhL